MIIEDSTSSLPTIDRFKEFVIANIEKEKIDTNITSESLIFDRKYAKYRHMPCSYPTAGNLLPGYMESTWINVILHKGLTPKLRSNIFHRKFDRRNEDIFEYETGKISDLLTDLSGNIGKLQGEKLDRKKTKDEIDTVLKGIMRTIGHDLSDSNRSYPATTLKLISLLYKISRERSSEIFQLIESPSKTGKYSLEFGNNTPDPRAEENSLIIADLTSYLNVLIPIDRLNVINQVNLDSHDLWNTISEHNLTTAKMIRIAHNGNANKINATYKKMTDAIEKFAPDRDYDREVQPAEALHTHLRTLQFRHHIGEYLNVFSNHHIDKDSIKATGDEIDQLCKMVGKDKNIPVHMNDQLLSISEFQEFVQKYDDGFRPIIALAKGAYIRKDEMGKTIDRAKKLLLLYIFNTHKTNDINKSLISVSDCVAALYTIRIQMNDGKEYLPYTFGQKPRGINSLRYFDNCKNIDELIKNDNMIPQGVKQLMYRKFCQTHSYMTGAHELHDSYVKFENTKLGKIANCFISNDVETIKSRVKIILDYCETVAIRYMLPELPGAKVSPLQEWANQGIK